MVNIWRLVSTIGCLVLATACMIAMPWACGDGGWGSGLPDTLIGDLPDGGGVAQDAGSIVDATEPGDAGVVYECGKGPGNSIGVGKSCTKSTGECATFDAGLSCDIDLDPQGVGICILIGCMRTQECGGSGAKCCAPPQSGGIKICLPPECLPPECGGPVPDGGVDGGGDAGAAADAGGQSDV